MNPLTDEYQIYLFPEPIRFKVKVNEEWMEGQIVSVRQEELGTEDEPGDLMDYLDWFTIKFSNGYTGEYGFNIDEVFTKNGEDQYSKAIQAEICFPFTFWYEDKAIHTLLWELDGKETNIWVYSADCHAKVEYFVEFKRDYRFSIKLEDNQWSAFTARQINPEPIEEALAKKVISMLKYYHE